MQNTQNYTMSFPQFVQKVEQRSISFPNVKDHKHPGVQSLPRQRVNTELFEKTAAEKKELSRLKAELKPAIGYTVSNSFNQKVN